MQQDSEKLDNYIIENQRFFPKDKTMYLREKLSNITTEELEIIIAIDLKDPSTFLLVSFLLGIFGVDRFMLGDIGYGLIKFFTAGGLGVLLIMDWFSVTKRVKELNFNKIILSIS